MAYLTIAGDIFTLIGEVITSGLTVVSSALSGVIPIFYVEETGFTVYGVLLLIGVGMSLIFFAWRVISSFIKRSV